MCSYSTFDTVSVFEYSNHIQARPWRRASGAAALGPQPDRPPPQVCKPIKHVTIFKVFIHLYKLKLLYMNIAFVCRVKYL